MSSDYDPNIQTPDLSKYDNETYEIHESDFDEVPNGTYQVRVHKVQITKTQSVCDMVKWQFKVIGPSHEGRIIFRNNVMATFANREWLMNDIHKCGIKIARFSELAPRLGELLDVCLEIKKETKGEHTNVYINRRIVIDGFGSGEDDSLAPF